MVPTRNTYLKLDRAGWLHQIQVRHVCDLALGCMLICYFPFFTFGAFFPSDIQPWAITLTGLFLAIQLPKMVELVQQNSLFSKLLLLSLLPVGYFLVVSIFYGTLNLRSLVSYVSIPIFFSLAAFVPNDVKRARVLTGYCFYIWSIVAALQQSIGSEFLTTLVRNARFGDMRGMVSFAPEPSAFGVQILMLALIFITFLNMEKSLAPSERRLHIGFCLATLVFAHLFLSRSFLGLACLSVFLSSWLIVSVLKKLRYVILAVFLVIVLIASIRSADLRKDIESWGQVSNHRYVNLLAKLAVGDFTFLITDESSNARLSAIVVSIGSLSQEGSQVFGYGSNSWSAYVAELLGSSKSIWTYVPGQDRIMSGFGAAIFELGLVGLLIPFSCFIILLRTKTPFMVSVQLTVLAVMINATSLALPLYSFLLGLSATYVGRVQLK